MEGLAHRLVCLVSREERCIAKVVQTKNIWAAEDCSCLCHIQITTDLWYLWDQFIMKIKDQTPMYKTLSHGKGGNLVNHCSFVRGNARTYFGFYCKIQGHLQSWNKINSVDSAGLNILYEFQKYFYRLRKCGISSCFSSDQEISSHRCFLFGFSLKSVTRTSGQ